MDHLPGLRGPLRDTSFTARKGRPAGNELANESPQRASYHQLPFNAARGANSGLGGDQT